MDFIFLRMACCFHMSIGNNTYIIMCGRVKHRGHDMSPNSTLYIRDVQGVRPLVWGTLDGYYNARSEKLYTTWRRLSSNRCILEVENFTERNGVFIPNDSNLLELGCIYNDNFFLVLTQQANQIVQSYHHRMPLIINGKEDYFMNENTIDFSIFNYQLELAS